MTDSDNNSVRSLSAVKPRGGRPAPSGPRVRHQSSFGNLLSLDGSPNNRDSSTSATSTSTSHSRESTLYSAPSSPRLPPTPNRTSTEPLPLENKLAVITESPLSPTPSNPLSPPQFIQSSESNDEAAVNSVNLPTSTETPSRPPSRVPSPSPSPKTRVVSKQATLLPPPDIKFPSMQIQWKGLPLEAALWTLDSRELQDIVSRAIRSSAQESFIRLLSTKQLDGELPAELERLRNSKATTQAKYRFHAQRRTMLLQALMSFSETSGDSSKDGGGTTGRLACQLSETTIECDKLSQELVGIMDQMSQVQHLLDVHWASALAIALRKLNGSYGKRTSELNQSRQRVTQLEGELEDAWKEAEKMAQEIDDIHAMDSEEEDDEDEDISRVVIQKAQVIAVPQAAKPVYVSSPPASERPSLEQEATQLPLPGSAVGSAFPISPSEDGEEDEADAASIHSRKSGKSFRSVGGQSRVSIVSAARKRSLRTSMGSLRLPVRTLSLVNLQRQHPVPVIPKKFSPGGALSPLSSTAPVPFSQPLHSLKQRNSSDVSLVDETLTAAQFQEIKNTRRISIDELNIEPSSVPQLPGPQYLTRREGPTSAVDDLYISRTGSTIGHGEEDSGMNNIGGVGVGLLLGGLGSVNGTGFGYGSPALATRRRRGSVDEQSIIANARRIGKDRQAQSIPSIWMNVDVTPASTSRSSRAQSPEPVFSKSQVNHSSTSGFGNERVFSAEPRPLPVPSSSTPYPATIITESSILQPNRFDETNDLQSPDSMLSPASAISTSPVSALSPSRSVLSRSNSRSARDKLKTFSKRMSGIGFSFQIPGHGKNSKEGKDDKVEEEVEETASQLHGLDEEELGFRVGSSTRPSTSRSTPIVGRRGSLYKRSMKSRSSLSTASFLSLK